MATCSLWVLLRGEGGSQMVSKRGDPVSAHPSRLAPFGSPGRASPALQVQSAPWALLAELGQRGTGVAV